MPLWSYANKGKQGEDNMSKRAALSDAKYARELLRQLLTEKDDSERAEIANELQAIIVKMAVELDTPGFN